MAALTVRKVRRSKRPKPDAAAGFATATPHSVLYVRGEADDSGIINICRWFEAADLVNAAKACGGLKLLPGVNVENVVARLNAESTITTRLANARRAPRDNRQRKLRSIDRAAKDLLRILGLPSDASPTMAHSVHLPPGIVAALQPGLSNVPMPIVNQLISLAGGVRILHDAADRAEEIAKDCGEDGKQAASRAMDRTIAQAVLGIVPVALATLRETAERGLAVVEAEPKRRVRGNTCSIMALLQALAGAHELLFGSPPQLRDKEFGRDTPSLRWTKSVTEAAASRLAADPNADSSARALFAKAASLSLATLSDSLQGSLQARLRANSA
jgi:hypothetical protein